VRAGLGCRAADDPRLYRVLVYAAAGLLAGRPATTYWSAFDELTAADPSIEIRPEDRFVDDGDVITAAGVSAGIDMACTWSPGSPMSNAPARYAAVSSTTLNLRSERIGLGTDGRLSGRGRTGPGIMRPRRR